MLATLNARQSIAKRGNDSETVDLGRLGGGQSNPDSICFASATKLESNPAHTLVSLSECK